MWPGPYGDGASRKYLISSLDQSLARMGLEYVDIFYSHRRDPETPDTPSHASRVKAKYGDEDPRQPRPNANRGDNVTGGSPYQDSPAKKGSAFGL